MGARNVSSTTSFHSSSLLRVLSLCSLHPSSVVILFYRSSSPQEVRGSSSTFCVDSLKRLRSRNKDADNEMKSSACESRSSDSNARRSPKALRLLIPDWFGLDRGREVCFADRCRSSCRVPKSVLETDKSTGLRIAHR
jgi:hypothetical protein